MDRCEFDKHAWVDLKAFVRVRRLRRGRTYTCLKCDAKAEVS